MVLDKKMGPYNDQTLYCLNYTACCNMMSLTALHYISGVLECSTGTSCNASLVVPSGFKEKNIPTVKQIMDP